MTTSTKAKPRTKPKPVRVEPEPALDIVAEPLGPDSIDIEADESLIPVRLVGVMYQAKTPKALVALGLAKRMSAAGSDTEAILAQIEEFTRLILGPDAAADVMRRLADPDDLLDIKHVMALVSALVERVTQQPPT